jgi:CRISPR-associated protein Cas2
MNVEPRAYFVTYDVCDPKRLRKVYETMRGYGEHMQLSVFYCELNPTNRVRMQAELEVILNHDQDQVLIVDLGPARAKERARLSALGRPMARRPEDAFVL